MHFSSLSCVLINYLRPLLNPILPPFNPSFPISTLLTPLNLSPGGSKSSAPKEQLPHFKGKQELILECEGVAPFRQRPTGQHHGVMDLLNQLIYQFLGLEFLPGHLKGELLGWGLLGNWRNKTEECE